MFVFREKRNRAAFSGGKKTCISISQTANVSNKSQIFAFERTPDPEYTFLARRSAARTRHTRVRVCVSARALGNRVKNSLTILSNVVLWRHSKALWKYDAYTHPSARPRIRSQSHSLWWIFLAFIVRTAGGGCKWRVVCRGKRLRNDADSCAGNAVATLRIDIDYESG